MAAMAGEASCLSHEASFEENSTRVLRRNQSYTSLFRISMARNSLFRARERFEMLGSVVFSEIRASTVGSNGGGEGVKEDRRRRGENDAKTKWGGDIWRCWVRDARETVVVL